MNKTLRKRSKKVVPPIFKPVEPPLPFNSDFIWIDKTEVDSFRYWLNSDCLNNMTLCES